jgi:hypothetical protein
MTLTLPQDHRDPGFQRHIARLMRAEQLYGRDSQQWRDVLGETWVTDHEFYGPEVETHCPHGHVDGHEIGHPPVNHDGREHVRRRCLTCSSTWLEPKTP